MKDYDYDFDSEYDHLMVMIIDDNSSEHQTGTWWFLAHSLTKLANQVGFEWQCCEAAKGESSVFEHCPCKIFTKPNYFFKSTGLHDCFGPCELHGGWWKNKPSLHHFLVDLGPLKIGSSCGNSQVHPTRVTRGWTPPVPFLVAKSTCVLGMVRILKRYPNGPGRNAAKRSEKRSSKRLPARPSNGGFEALDLSEHVLPGEVAPREQDHVEVRGLCALDINWSEV